MRVRARKRYWLANGAAALVLAVLINPFLLLLFPLIWTIDRTFAEAAYKREELSLPPSWYDGFSKWEFERVNSH